MHALGAAIAVSVDGSRQPRGKDSGACARARLIPPLTVAGETGRNWRVKSTIFSNSIYLPSLIAALACFSADTLLAQPSPPAGFTALFNGRDLNGWHGMKDMDLRK